MLPEDKQEFASQLRRRQLQRQLPLHDLDPRFCTSLNEKETAKYEKFIEKRRKKAAGIGQIGEVSSSGNLVGTKACLFFFPGLAKSGEWWCDAGTSRGSLSFFFSSFFPLSMSTRKDFSQNAQYLN